MICRTYAIPKEVREWREWMNTQKGRDGTMWMLKTAQHLGKGLTLVPHQRAIKEMLMRHESAEAAKAAGKAKQVMFPSFSTRMKYKLHPENPLCFMYSYMVY